MFEGISDWDLHQHPSTITRHPSRASAMGRGFTDDTALNFVISTTGPQRTCISGAAPGERTSPDSSPQQQSVLTLRGWAPAPSNGRLKPCRSQGILLAVRPENARYVAGGKLEKKHGTQSAGTLAESGGPAFAVDDPLSSLHPTARAILEAAQQILAEQGFAALSIQAITSRVGVNKAAVHYHFGSKDGLILAIVDALIHDECLELVRETQSLHGEQRVRAYIRGILNMVNDVRSFQSYYEMLPYILRSPYLRGRITGLYRWYFDWTNFCLGFEELTADPARRQGFGQLIVAISDGLALQKLLNAEELKAEHPYAMLESLLYDLFTGSSSISRFSEPELPVS